MDEMAGYRNWLYDMAAGCIMFADERVIQLVLTPPSYWWLAATSPLTIPKQKIIFCRFQDNRY